MKKQNKALLIILLIISSLFLILSIMIIIPMAEYIIKFEDWYSAFTLTEATLILIAFSIVCLASLTSIVLLTTKLIKTQANKEEETN